MTAYKGFVSHIVYRNEENSYTVFELTLTGSDNNDGSAAALVEVTATTEPEPPKTTVRLNEYSTSKTQTLLTADGDFCAWAELYNPGDAAVSLQGFTLSDNETRTDKWVFPAVTINAKSFLVVLLSGEDKTYDGTGELHASFSLNGKEDVLLLCDALGREIDRCKVYPLRANLSCGRTKDGWRFFACATPGAKNSTDAFDSVDSAALTDSKQLVITELAAVNTGTKAPDGSTPGS